MKPTEICVVSREWCGHGKYSGFELLGQYLPKCRIAPELPLLPGIARRIAADRSINKVEQVAQEYKIGVRRLQRLFADYVGVSPKWVIQRYRLHEAAERIATTSEPNWAAFALDLGYADQAHFIRDFKKLVGVTPADYFASRRGG